ncbi:glutathione S-transferase family protein [Thiosocius teredinicola]|uniref:glutathione S-transferase family protein n=1 Tax=Thiosocius teredinicola TaxID=1973002 RepID=UPI000990E1AE
MRKLYGVTQSRAFRPLWVMHELGLDFEQVPLDFRGDDLRAADYLALNPNGRIPTLVDDDFVLWESMAITLYLARKYDNTGLLWPSSVEGEARAWQWSFWVMTEVEAPLLSVLMHTRVLPEEKRKPEKAKRDLGLLKAPFSVLEKSLHDRDYLLGEAFSIADLNVAAVMSWCKPARVVTRDYPNLDDWLKRCLARPARKAAQKT